MKTYTVAASTINNLRKKSTMLWMTEEVLDTDLGWSVSKWDVHHILQVFSPLTLSKQVRLCGFQYREEESGEGLILALPKDLNPKSLLQNLETMSYDEYIPNQFLLADNSPYNYMLASLFKRECREFGAFGHGINWMDHQIIESLDSYQTMYDDTQIPIHASEWNWLNQIPSSLQFSITEENDQVTVAFFTIYERQQRVIKKHIDVYSKGKFNPITETIVVATGK